MPMASHFNQANHSGKSILARAARLFYSRRGRRTNMNYYLLLLIFAAMNEVYAEFFTEPYPARAAFQAAGIPNGALVEIECVAVKG